MYPCKKNSLKKARILPDAPLTKLNAIAKKYKDLLFAFSIFIILVSLVISILDLDRCAPPADPENPPTITEITFLYLLGFLVTIEKFPQKSEEKQRDPIVNKIIDEARRFQETGNIAEAIEKWQLRC